MRTLFVGGRKMRPLKLFIVVILVAFAACGFAQGAITVTVPAEPASPNDVNAISSMSFPYVAEVTGDDVYIRSGAGTQYYNCGKLKRGDKVKVVGVLFSWSRIVPPDGSFSWISNQYVSIDSNNPGTGIVTGDGVRVYAGSDYVRPIHSTTLQLKLDKGEKVKLLGEEKDNYYKIATPAGAYLWVSSDYMKPLGPVGGTVEFAGLKVEPNETAVVVTGKGSVEDEMLKVYYALEKQLQAERAKPIEQQNYASIKKAFADIAANKEAGKAARYAEFVIKQVERLEFVVAAVKEVGLQNEQLQQTRDKIDKARATRLAKLEEMGRFAVIGQLKTSSIFGSEPQLKYYRITDESDKIICYALPGGQASTMDLSKLIDHKVGLVGTLEAHPQTGTALVRFTEVVELK
jgi:uncharacterized protein YraI